MAEDVGIVRWIYFISFLDLAAVSMAVPLLSSRLKYLGASHFFIGLSASTYGALQLITGPVIGTWSDLRGRRTILLVTVAVCSVCYIATGIAISTLLILILRIVVGIMKHTQTLCRALIGDYVPTEQHAEANGKLMTFAGIGFMVGPAIAGHLMEMNDGFFKVHQCVALIFLLILGVVYVFLPLDKINTTSQQHSRDSGPMTAIKELTNVDWNNYWDILILKFLLGLSMACFYSGYSLYLQDKFNTDSKSLGYTISFQGMVGALSGFGSGYIEKMYSNDMSRTKQMLHGFIMLAISYFALFISHNLLSFIIFLIPLGISSSLLRISLHSAVLERSPPDRLGSLIGSGSSMASISRTVAPLITGIIQDILGDFGFFFLSIFAACIGAIIVVCVSISQTKRIKTD